MNERKTQIDACVHNNQIVELCAPMQLKGPSHRGTRDVYRGGPGQSHRACVQACVIARNLGSQAALPKGARCGPEVYPLLGSCVNWMMPYS